MFFLRQHQQNTLSKFSAEAKLGSLKLKVPGEETANDGEVRGRFTQQNDSGMMQEDEQIFAAGCNWNKNKYQI